MTELFNGIIIDGAHTQHHNRLHNSNSNGTNAHHILYPRHPLKYAPPPTLSNSKGTTNSSMMGLLDAWPSYLERLLPTSPNRFAAFAETTNTTQQSSSSSSSSSGYGGIPQQRMHRVYEGSSAGGRGLPSRCPPVYPYDVPTEGLCILNASNFDVRCDCILSTFSLQPCWDVKNLYVIMFVIMKARHSLGALCCFVDSISFHRIRYRRAIRALPHI